MSEVFAKRLHELRENAGLSQKALGEFMSVSQQTVWKWENNVNEPDMDSIRRIAQHFDVTTDYLLGLVDGPNEYSVVDTLAANSDVPLNELSDDDKAQVLDFIKFRLAQKKSGKK